MSSPDRDQDMEVLEQMQNDGILSPSYIYSVVQEYWYTKKELRTLEYRTEAKRRVTSNLSRSHAEITAVIVDMEKQIQEDQPVWEQEKMMLQELKRELDKLQMKHRQVVEDPMSNYLIQKDLELQSKSKAREQLNNPDLLKETFKDLQDKKQDMDKKLANAEITIQNLKSQLDNFHVPEVSQRLLMLDEF